MAEDDLDGAEKAAILLKAVGEKAAAEVLKHMEPNEVQKIGSAIAQLEAISKEQVQDTLEDFAEQVNEETGIGMGNEDYVRNVLIGALGEDRALGMLDRILDGSNKGLEALKWLDTRGIVDLVSSEHPQIIAIVISYLDSAQAADVLREFPENMRSDILLRIATLEGVQPSAMLELNEILEQQLRRGSNSQASGIGGVKLAASILNFMDSSVEEEILKEVKDVDGDLGQRIEDLMFVFDDLQEIDNRDMQTLLREISSEQLVLALKGADDTVREKVFAGMSQRAGEMLKEDLEAKGPVRLSEVEEAQKEVLAIARKLGDDGSIVLAGPGGEAMV